MSWTADSTHITADSTYAMADGSIYVPGVLTITMVSALTTRPAAPVLTLVSTTAQINLSCTVPPVTGQSVIAGYLWERAAAVGGPYTTVTSTVGTSTTDTGSLAGFYYRVSAIDQFTTGFPSVPVFAALVNSSPLTVPGTPTAVYTSGTGVTVDWSPSTGTGLSVYFVRRNNISAQTVPAFITVTDQNGNDVLQDNSLWTDPAGVVGDVYTVRAGDGTVTTALSAGGTATAASGGGGGVGTFLITETWEGGTIDLSKWNNPENLGTIPAARKVVTAGISRNPVGTYAIRNYVDTSAPYASSKSPLHTELGALGNVNFGTVYWYAFSIYLENWVTEWSTAYVASLNNNNIKGPWDIVWQDHGRENYTYTAANGTTQTRGLNPPANLSVRTDNTDGLGYWFFQVIGDRRSVAAITNNGLSSPSYEYSKTVRGPRYTPNQWADVIIRQKLCTAAAPFSGEYDVWINAASSADTPAFSDRAGSGFSGLNCFPGTDDYNGVRTTFDVWKFGIYKGFSAGGPVTSRAVRHDEIRWQRESDGGSFANVNPVTYAGPRTGTFPLNPVTQALNATGTGTRYDVTSDAQMDAVPWGTLTAGSVVNIFWKSTPYHRKFGIRAQGTSTNPVIINGVTDGNGNRPDLDFNNALSCLNSASVFNTAQPQYYESLGGIYVERGPGDPYGTYQPKFIQIKNLKCHGAANGNTFTTLLGATYPYGDSAGIRFQLAEDSIIENCEVYDNAFGIFTMAKDGIASEACKRLTLRNNKVYGNGVVGAYYQHNFYVQSIGVTVEGNYIGQTRSGSLGSSYKSRSSGEIFRYNYVIASARAMDFVHSEDNSAGVEADPQYGLCHCYGNTILNDANLGNFAGAAVHFGGDQSYEDGPAGSTLIDPATLANKQRPQFCFFNNTYIQRASLAQSYRTHLFGLALVATRADIWDNIFVIDGTSNWQMVQFAGQMHVWGGNIIYRRGGALALAAAHDQADATRYTVTYHTTPTNIDPLFVNYASNDFHLTAASPAINACIGQPSNAQMPWPPARISNAFPNPAAYINPSTQYPLAKQFTLNNQMVVRNRAGAADDLGAFEFGSG